MSFNNVCYTPASPSSSGHRCALASPHCSLWQFVVVVVVVAVVVVVVVVVVGQYLV